MLVLMRRIGEEIVIAHDIRVEILSVKGERVSLGITAPSSVPVLRRELLGPVPQRNRVAERRSTDAAGS